MQGAAEPYVKDEEGWMLAEVPKAGLPQAKGEVLGSVSRGLWWLQCRKLVLSQQHWGGRVSVGTDGGQMLM